MVDNAMSCMYERQEEKLREERDYSTGCSRARERRSCAEAVDQVTKWKKGKKKISAFSSSLKPHCQPGSGLKRGRKGSGGSSISWMLLGNVSGEEVASWGQGWKAAAAPAGPGGELGPGK